MSLSLQKAETYLGSQLKTLTPRTPPRRRGLRHQPAPKSENCACGSQNSMQSQRRAMPGVRLEKKDIANARALNMPDACRTFLHDP